MTNQSPRLIFRSSRFAIEPGEDDATNPGIFGRSLATWLGAELVPGFSGDDVIAEDFGWLVSMPGDGPSLYVACSSTDERADEWQVMVFAESGLVSRLLGRSDPTEAVARLYAAVRQRVAAEAGITDVREEP